MQGKIIKGIAGFYYIYAENDEIYECKAKGIFRKDKQKPLVGDNVEIEVLDEQEKEGSVTAILPRKNSLIRPAVANVDQAFVIFAMESPKPNFMLLDRFLIMMEKENVPAVICFNKKDLAKQEELEFLYETYKSCGYDVIFSSTFNGEGLDEIREILKGIRDATRGGVGTVLYEIAGQSQVGIRLRSEDIPVQENVKGVCGMLGLEPLYLACEGRLVIFAPKEHAEAIVEKLRQGKYTKDAAIIGEVTEEMPGRVVMTTEIGAETLLPEPRGELLPRIC